MLITRDSNGNPGIPPEASFSNEIIMLEVSPAITFPEPDPLTKPDFEAENT